MNDDLGYELRSTWRRVDAPDSEVARLQFENSRLRDAIGKQSLIDQAVGILMAASRTDSDTMRRKLTEVAKVSRLRVVDLARAVVEVTTDASHHENPRAVEVATTRLLGRIADLAGPDARRRTKASGRPTIDLRSMSAVAGEDRN